MLVALSAPAVGADCKLERYAELPVIMADTRPLIAGSVNGVDALFLADSGAFFSMLSLDSTQRFKLRLDSLPRGMEVRGVSGVADVHVARVKDFILRGLNKDPIHDVEFLVGGNAIAGGVAGIIGQNVIGHADSEYDLANGVIRLIHPKDCGDHVLAYWHGDAPIAIVPIASVTPMSPHLIGSAMLNGSKIGVLFDTGSMRSMLDFRAARRAGIKLDGPEVTAGGSWQGVNGKTFETFITRVDSLDLGGELIKNARLRVADIETPHGADMVLGADFFLSHHIYVAATQHRIYFTYNGGHVFDLRTSDTPQQDSAAPTPGTPTDAGGFMRRAAASAARRDYGSALADFDQAIALDPKDPQYYYQRGVVRWQAGDPAAAAADFDQALKLRPDYIPALLERGSQRLRGQDEAGARADFDQATALAPNDATLSLRIAATYMGTGHFEEAIDRLDRWAQANPRDDRLPAVLAARCRSRAFAGTGLDQALSDCNAALNRGHRTADVYDGRALLWLRLGKFDKSIGDYRESLGLQPKVAETLYGLGLAEHRKGLTAAGDADMAAATALKPEVVQDFNRAGLAP
jgi:tetratricopeptide (TPR) repeat protein